MLAQNALGTTTTSPSGGRVFLYEVSGLRQTSATQNSAHQIRKSGSVFFKVPYNRMNEEMQRIARLGGKIVSITPVENA
ncbi:MAG TPA: phycobilisome linker polypeptide [Leptolyngbyaceae cyanobacterium]